MKGIVTRPADVKRGKLPRKTSGNPYGALAQLVARDIRIVEVRGSTPLCSTSKTGITLTVVPVFELLRVGGVSPLISTVPRIFALERESRRGPPVEEIPSAAFSTEREQAPQCGAATIEVAEQGFDSPMLHQKTLQIKACKVFSCSF